VPVVAELVEVLQVPGPVVVVFVAVRVQHALVRVVAGLLAQHVAVQVAETHDEGRHAGEEGQPLARRERLVAQVLEEGQGRVATLELEDVMQDRFHGQWVMGREAGCSCLASA